MSTSNEITVIIRKGVRLGCYLYSRNTIYHCPNNVSTYCLSYDCRPLPSYRISPIRSSRRLCRRLKLYHIRHSLVETYDAERIRRVIFGNAASRTVDARNLWEIDTCHDSDRLLNKSRRFNGSDRQFNLIPQQLGRLSPGYLSRMGKNSRRTNIYRLKSVYVYIRAFFLKKYKQIILHR